MNFCSKCGKQVDDGVTMCDECMGLDSANTTQSPKKGRKPLVVALISAAAVIVVTVIVGLCTNWFGLVSPLNGMLKACKNTLTADSLTVEISYDGEDQTTYIDWGRKDGEMAILMEDGYSKTLYTDGERYYYSEDGASIYDTDEESEILDTYVESSNKNLDFKKLVENTILDDYVDSDEVTPWLKEFYKEFLCNGKWLEETAGFTKEKNIYKFTPELEDLCEDIIDFCNDSDALDSEAQETIEESFEELSDYARHWDTEAEIEVTVEGKYLSEINVIVKYNDGERETFSIEFKDINKTEFSEEAEELQDDVNRWIKDHECDVCGEVMYYDEHGTCKDCGQHVDDFYSYDDKICYDCYYEHWEKCYNCYELYSNSYDYCPNCYPNSAYGW